MDVWPWLCFRPRRIKCSHVLYRDDSRGSNPLHDGYQFDQFGKLICWELLKSSAESHWRLKIFHMENLQWNTHHFYDNESCYSGKFRLGSLLLAALVVYQKNRGSDFLQVVRTNKQSCAAANYSHETEILIHYASIIKANLHKLALNPYFLSEQVFNNYLSLMKRILDLVLFHTAS